MLDKKRYAWPSHGIVYGIMGGSPSRDLWALSLLTTQVARKRRTGLIKANMAREVGRSSGRRDSIAFGLLWVFPEGPPDSLADVAL